jgi:hypothetical protein
MRRFAITFDGVVIEFAETLDTKYEDIFAPMTIARTLCGYFN